MVNHFKNIIRKIIMKKILITICICTSLIFAGDYYPLVQPFNDYITAEYTTFTDAETIHTHFYDIDHPDTMTGSWRYLFTVRNHNTDTLLVYWFHMDTTGVQYDYDEFENPIDSSYTLDIDYNTVDSIRHIGYKRSTGEVWFYVLPNGEMNVAFRAKNGNCFVKQWQIDKMSDPWGTL
jgi:hypothetical protein